MHKFNVFYIAKVDLSIPNFPCLVCYIEDHYTYTVHVLFTEMCFKEKCMVNVTVHLFPYY